MEAETVESFLARGGKIHTIKGQDDRYAHRTTHFHYQDPGFRVSRTRIENAFRTAETVKRNRSNVGPAMTGKKGKQGKHLRGFRNYNIKP